MTPDPTALPVVPPAGRYLLTGAAGFIGGHLLGRLLDAGCTVLCADLAPPKVLPAGARFVRCDLTDRASVKAALAGERLDYAVHLAAKVGDWGPRADFEAINVHGTRWALDGALEAGARAVVHLSSIAAMGLDAGDHADETVPPIPAGEPYSATKAAGERVARELQSAGAPVIVVRPGDVYGVGSVPWVVRPVQLLRSRQLVLVDGGRGHFAHTHVDNLLDGVLAALGSPAALGETFLVTDGDAHCTMGDYFRRLAAAVGAPTPRVSLPLPVARGLAGVLEAGARLVGATPPFTRVSVDFMCRRGSFSIEKARTRLGYAPRVTLDAGLAAIGRHYQGGGV